MFEFTPYKLDPETVRLFKNNQIIETEPQVFNTLLLLIENRHRVVSKEELFEIIWHGRAVSEHVITRIIYELRKTLDAKEQGSYIRTVRGKGYQFIADVVELPNSQDAVIITEQPRKSTGLHVVLYSVLLLLPLMFGYWYSNRSVAHQPISTKQDTPVKTSEISDYPVVVVLPIEVNENNEKLSMLTLSLIDYLTNQLALNLNMKIVHPDSMVRINEDLNDIWAIQQATRAQYIVQGTVENVTDESIKIHFNLYKKDALGELTPFSLGAFDFPYPQSSQDLNNLYKQRKVTVRDMVSIIKPGIVFNASDGNDTEDPEAYRLAIAAHHMVKTDACKQMTRAESLLLKAIDRDPKFGFAYHQLFTNYFKRVWVCGDSAEYHQKALDMAEIAEQLSPNTYQSLAIGRNTILVESNQVEKAYELSKDNDWNDPAAIYRTVYGLRYAGFLNKASEYLDRIMQLDPYYFSEKPIQQAPSTLLYQNRFDEHIALLAEPGNSYHDYYRSLNFVLQGKQTEAEPILRAVLQRTPDDLFGQFSQALLFVIDDDKPAAIALIDKMLNERKVNQHYDGEMTYKLLQLYALVGADDLALEALQLAVDQGFFPFNYFLNDPALESIRGTDKFNAVIEKAIQRHEAFAARFGLSSEANISDKTVSKPTKQ